MNAYDLYEEYWFYVYEKNSSPLRKKLVGLLTFNPATEMCPKCTYDFKHVSCKPSMN